MLTPEWCKSSYSSSNANCVEVCNNQTTVAVRDSKDVMGPRLDFTGQAWAAFVSGIKRGELDL
jgi:Domain of unknown function (DUF397)